MTKLNRKSSQGLKLKCLYFLPSNRNKNFFFFYIIQNKIVKQNEKKVYDLEKDNKKYKEDLKQVKEEFSVLKSQINKEKKDAERRNKKNEKKQFSKHIKEESIKRSLNARSVVTFLKMKFN